MESNVFAYEIDRQDVITKVSDNWQIFAEQNGWLEGTRLDNVLNHPLWNFIDGDEAQHLYRALLKRVRENRRVSAIPFRCDSPTERRFLSLIVTLLPDGGVRFSSSIVRTESRSPVELLDKTVPRSDRSLRICSVCKKIEVREEVWLEVERGLVELRIFEEEVLPRLTHGVCPDCLQLVMTELEADNP